MMCGDLTRGKTFLYKSSYIGLFGKYLDLSSMKLEMCVKGELCVLHGSYSKLLLQQ
jgi:hypothetical protein